MIRGLSLKKIIFIISFFLLFNSSNTFAYIIGKVLKCEVRENFYSSDLYPFYFFFKSNKQVQLAVLEGYNIKWTNKKYTLLGSKFININDRFYINRENLYLNFGNINEKENAFECTIFLTKNELIKDIKKFLNTSKNKNRF